MIGTAALSSAAAPNKFICLGALIAASVLLQRKGNGADSSAGAASAGAEHGEYRHRAGIAAGERRREHEELASRIAMDYAGASRICLHHPPRRADRGARGFFSCVTFISNALSPAHLVERRPRLFLFFSPAESLPLPPQPRRQRREIDRDRQGDCAYQG